jgi:hypothetical protein
MCCLCLFLGRVASLLWPRPFLNKLNNALFSRKFCERHNYSFKSIEIAIKFKYKIVENKTYEVTLLTESIDMAIKFK